MIDIFYFGLIIRIKIFLFILRKLSKLEAESLPIMFFVNK